jgi:PKD repeat protein
MKKISLKYFGAKLILLTVLALPELASAQTFTYNLQGDVLAGFRKTGSFKGNYELVVDLGNVTNLLAQTVGTTINITNYSTSQLTNAFTDTGNFANLQWSVFSGLANSGRNVSYWSTPVGLIPTTTLWFTLPATNVNIQTQPPTRSAPATQAQYVSPMNGVGSGAVSIANALNVTNANCNAFLVREPVSYNQLYLTASIGDSINSAVGDFAANGVSPLNIVENTTLSPFTAAQRDDFYEVCPSGYADPVSGSTTNAYFVGYFLLNPDGSMTFTRASSTPAAPVVGSVTSTVTNGFGPLTVVFTNTATGSITNWNWSFGDGTIINNTTGANVTNTYVAGGSYTVTLTVNGPGGSSSDILTNYIVASPTPSLSNVTRFGGNLVFGGSNCPAGVQYRILSTTNLTTALTNWLPVSTNTFLSNGTFTYTNSATTNSAFFRLVSP